jgi:hypothetical protein
MSPGENWPRHPPTVRLEEDLPSELSGLSKQENRRMRWAMVRGRPLPPRLARAAVQYAPRLQRHSYLGYLLLAMGLLHVPFVIWGVSHRFGWWMAVAWLAVGLCWLLLGGWWLWLTRRAGRAVRDGFWPEQPRAGGDPYAPTG